MGSPQGVGDCERRYTTAQIAQAVCVHPNTVRLYERIGLLAPISRTAGGYRSFSERDLAQMRVARLAVGGPYVVPKTFAVEAVRRAALDDLDTALELAGRFGALVAGEETAARRSAGRMGIRAGERRGSARLGDFGGCRARRREHRGAA